MLCLTVNVQQKGQKRRAKSFALVRTLITLYEHRLGRLGTPVESFLQSMATALQGIGATSAPL